MLFFRSAELLVINYCGVLKNYLVRFVLYIERYILYMFFFLKN